MSAPHITDDDKHTHMLMQWGQFLDHDLDLAPQAISFAQFADGTRCNETCENKNPCFPIPVPTSDLRIQRHACLGVTRSAATCNSGMTSLFYNTVSVLDNISVFFFGSLFQVEIECCTFFFNLIFFLAFRRNNKESKQCICLMSLSYKDSEGVNGYSCRAGNTG